MVGLMILANAALAAQPVGEAKCPRVEPRMAQGAKVRVRPLTQEPPAKGYRTIYRKDDRGCVRPVVFRVTVR